MRLTFKSKHLMTPYGQAHTRLDGVFTFSLVSYSCKPPWGSQAVCDKCDLLYLNCIKVMTGGRRRLSVVETMSL